MIHFKKILLYILIIIVFFLIITAFYCNRHKFNEMDTMRYTKIVIDHGTSLSELANKYSNSRTKTKFLSEIKRVNDDIDTLDYIPGSATIIIPVIEIK